MQLGRAEFEQLVDDALASIPTQLMAQVDNVAVLIENEPPPQQPHLLGLYYGLPLTERDTLSWGPPQLPDTITLYQGPLQRMCSTPQQLVEQVRITVVHEIAHYFGFNDEQLHAWGWG